MNLRAYDVALYVSMPFLIEGLIQLLRKLYPRFAIEAELRQIRAERRRLHKRPRR